MPIIRVSDAEAAVRWYERLGFEVRAEHRFEPGLPAYVGIARGDVELHLSEHEGDAPPGTLIYLWVDDVDAVASAVGTHVTQETWARETEVGDPDGNRIRIGQIGSSAP